MEPSSLQSGQQVIYSVNIPAESLLDHTWNYYLYLLGNLGQPSDRTPGPELLVGACIGNVGTFAGQLRTSSRSNTIYMGIAT